MAKKIQYDKDFDHGTHDLDCLPITCITMNRRHFIKDKAQQQRHHKLVLLLLLTLSLTILQSVVVVASSSMSSQTLELPATSSVTTNQNNVVKTGTSNSNNKLDDIRIIFSDVDGTLVHYPDKIDSSSDDLVFLPPSSTGMRGVISVQTLRRCQDLRKTGTKLVLISGMRTSTLCKRLPFLPKADAYVCEGGGRIFMTTTNDSSGYNVVPVSFEKSQSAENLEDQAFHLTEDMEWRKRIQEESAAGTQSYKSAELIDDDTQQEDVVALSQRDGTLWKFARDLETLGFKLDTKGYATCFRVNQKHQNKAMLPLFSKLVAGKIAHPPELATSINLGCVDFYPSISGKKNCCEYLAGKLGNHDDNDGDSFIASEILSRHAICICDDDNDMDMALACAHAYLPGISSQSMDDLVKRRSDQFTVTKTDSVKETAATEVALTLILAQLELSKSSLA